MEKRVSLKLAPFRRETELNIVMEMAGMIGD
jgi:hypothetical protein